MKEYFQKQFRVLFTACFLIVAAAPVFPQTPEIDRILDRSVNSTHQPEASQLVTQDGGIYLTGGGAAKVKPQGKAKVQNNVDN